MSDYRPKVGDRVRVVLEGEVAYAGLIQNRIDLGDGGFAWLPAGSTAIVSIEKIEPPVEFFKPGDVVRNTDYPEHVYTLGKDGYYSHMAERFYEPCGPFTSADYELVYRP